ncbi:Type III effector HopPmaJ [Winogradskyella psychrotolerans RS-3]|uniref:Type III effector HopPmaJ n=1 Tax=Winogradskyella psychrotolerans RS-3 TaxID=641526 RepID=S7X082_9FLAO|nr:HopJ type III effector protein [Winogradskyella psychrotolerans]EPR72434.1 Type III effector HopPmaJ [Winogradskyella psychrotolerans RS-3]
MALNNFLVKLKSSPKHIKFSETMNIIEAHYEFIPTAFKNGTLHNGKGENSGSCKLFAFAVHQNLKAEETLACFGNYYFEDVLINPKGTGHQNMRNFITSGFQGLHFETFPLKKK